MAGQVGRPREFDEDEVLSNIMSTFWENGYEGTGLSDIIKATGPPMERLETFMSGPIDAAYNQNDWRGCFLCNASADYAAMDEETRRLVARGYRKLEDALCIPIAQLNTRWNDEKSRQTARMLLALYSGLRVMSRAAIERPRLEDARDAGLALLKG